MAGGRCTAVQARPPEFLALPSVLLEALPQLVPPCEAACHAPMAAGHRDGTPRTARQLPVSQPCPPFWGRILSLRVAGKIE